MVDQFSRDALFAQAARFRTQPGFQQGKRRHTDIGLEVVEGEPVVAKLVCQTGRYATMLLIMSLYDVAENGESPGATSSQLLAAIGRTPFASVAWAKLMVRVYHRAGLIDYAPPGADRRVRPFFPTPRLLELGYESMTIFLEALSHVRSLPAPPAELVRRPGMLTGFARVVVDCYFDHRFSMLEPFPELDDLFKRDFGYLVFAQLLQTMREAEPGRFVASAHTGDLQRRFGVSRGSVRNVLDVIEAKGLIVQESKAGHRLLCTPALVELADRWVATELAWMSFILDTTLRRLDARATRLAA
jgi:hypothetical protein